MKVQTKLVNYEQEQALILVAKFMEKPEFKKAVLNLIGEKIIPYNVIDEQIKRSRIERTNWKKLLGNTLTKRVAELYAKGKTPTEAYEILSLELSEKGVSDEKTYKNLKIGVSSRYAEITSESKEIRKWKL